jgi:aminopeptidase-like protein
VATPTQGRVISFLDCNLHVVHGSLPVKKRMPWDDLRPHLHVDAHRPQAIPYRTAYGRQTWGFCLTQRQFEQLESDKHQQFDVEIDSEYRFGSLTYGEVLLPGSSSQECLLHTHSCHPSLANDNLSGLVVLAALYTLLSREPRRYSYRFLVAPATIGAITWLARNQPLWERMHHGLILTCLGDRGPLTYKCSRSGSAPTDRVARHWNTVNAPVVSLRPFEPFGYDERQFCSPGINLPIGRLTRTPSGEFPEYHTSDDNLGLLHLPSLQDSLASLLQMLEAIEADVAWSNTKPFCEPRLDRYGLCGAQAGGHVDVPLQRAVRWVLNLSCGQHTLLDIAERSRLPIPLIVRAARLLSHHGLLRPEAQMDRHPVVG